METRTIPELGGFEMGETSRGVLERGSARIVWRSEGSGPAIVFVHGGGMDSRMWRPQADAFAEQCHVVTYDQRGHGQSSCAAADYSLDSATEDLAALMDHLDVERAVLVTHSFGATVAQQFALLHPQRVRALACIGGSPIGIRPSLSARIRARINPTALALLGRPRVQAMFANMAGAREEVRLYAASALSHLTAEMFSAVMRVGFGVPDSELGGYRLHAPLLLVYGDRDPYTAYFKNTVRWVVRDGARLVRVPGAAHNANQDAPEEVNREISRLLGDVS
jgi:3-oxoadipate enol-lactonase